MTTEWVAGGVAEVGWGIIANHGGGYSYRLCRRAEGEALTEECFQQMPLRCLSVTSHTMSGDV